MKTVTILIGNTDNKLTQQKWAEFASCLGIALPYHCNETFFFGGPANWEPYQNACWVVAVKDENTNALKTTLGDLRKQFNQDSIAVVIGETEFV